MGHLENFQKKSQNREKNLKIMIFVIFGKIDIFVEKIVFLKCSRCLPASDFTMSYLRAQVESVGPPQLAQVRKLSYKSIRT